MTISDQIMQDMKTAMKAKDTVRLTAIRAIKSQFLLAKTAKGGNDQISDEQAIIIIQKMIKQRNDAAQIYKEQGREDLYNQEIGELKFLETYMPKQFSDAELTDFIKEIISETGANSLKEMGRVIGLANKKIAGRAGGKIISEKVKELLQ